MQGQAQRPTGNTATHQAETKDAQVTADIWQSEIRSTALLMQYSGA
jgi:hypothetical protein